MVPWFHGSMRGKSGRRCSRRGEQQEQIFGSCQGGQDAAREMECFAFVTDGKREGDLVFLRLLASMAKGRKGERATKGRRKDDERTTKGRRKDDERTKENGTRCTYGRLSTSSPVLCAGAAIPATERLVFFCQTFESMHRLYLVFPLCHWLQNPMSSRSL